MIFEHDLKVALVVKSVQYSTYTKNYSTYTNSIPTHDRKTELAVKKNLPTLRKEIIFEHDRKVGLVVKSVQYSTYTKTIVRIPTCDRETGLAVKKNYLL